MAMTAGMTSAIMNPIALPVPAAKIAEKKIEVEAAGIVLPEGLDDETFCLLFGLGSTRPRAGKEMEAIRAANFLTNNDPSGGEWIKFNRPAVKEGEGRARTGRRSRG
jgi:5-methyltetrahydrofolate--homocysteine methyltransferase